MFQPDGVIGKRQRKVLENLFYHIDPNELARAYEGEHGPNFAEPEFAGKYMDICRAFCESGLAPDALERAGIVAESVIRNQRRDGYLGTFRAGLETEGFSVWNQAFTCFGLLSYFSAAKDGRALDAAERCVAYVAELFSRESGHRWLDGGNQGSQHLAILLPAAQLYAVTGKAVYRDLCEGILRECAESPTHDLLRRPSVMGMGSLKGIEMLAFLLGAAVYARETGKSELLDAVKAYRRDVNDTQITLTGCGTIGENWHRRGGDPAMTPVEVQPNENCVAVGWMELSVLLYDMTHDAAYYHAFERTLYNHLFGSQAPDGSDYAYFQGNYGLKVIATAGDRYSCCRYRGLTMMAHLDECAVFENGDDVYLPLYAAYTCSGRNADIEMDTRYPADGRVTVRVTPKAGRNIRVFFRVPDGCELMSLKADGRETAYDTVNGHAVPLAEPRGEGTVYELTFRLLIRRAQAVLDGQTTQAVTYGPVVLAIDTVNGTPVYSTTIDPDAAISPIEAGEKHIVRLETTGTVRGKRQKLTLTDYATSGMEHPGRDRFRVWLPVTGTDMEGIY